MALNFPNKKARITTSTERQIKQKSSTKTTNMAKANLGMDLEELINKYDYRLELRHQLLESVALRILTSATTKKIGYFRAKMFLAEMNLSFGLNLTTDDIDDVYFAEYPEEMVEFISQMKGKVYQKKNV